MIRVDKATLEDKRDFIRHFLEKQELKNKLCHSLLNYLCNYDELLDKLHFVDNARPYEHAIVVTAKYMDYVPFAFYSKGSVSADPESTFKTFQVEHKTNQFRDLYIQVNFIGKEADYRYLNIVENRIESTELRKQNAEDKKLANSIIASSINNFTIQALYKKIDIALDQRNKTDFQLYSTELITLLQNKKQTH